MSYTGLTSYGTGAGGRMAGADTVVAFRTSRSIVRSYGLACFHISHT